MMKQEFEQAIGITVSAEAFEHIEAVYLNSEFFASKEQLYSFYKQYDMNGIERMYKDVLVRLRQQVSIKNLQDRISNLQSVIRALRGFKSAIVDALAKYGEVI
jgi:hypothetical protein